MKMARHAKRATTLLLRLILSLIGGLALQVSFFVGTIVLYGVGMFVWHGDAAERTKALLFLAVVVAASVCVRVVFIRICRRVLAGDAEDRQST